MKRRAFIGDIHGSLAELRILYGMLASYGLDSIWHCGDLVDKGLDPGGVVKFCRENGIDGVMGNHTSAIRRYLNKGTIPKNPDKAKSVTSLLADPLSIDYINKLPYYRIHDEKLLHVHAGYSPYKPIDESNHLLAITSLLHPEHPDKSEWMGKTREEVNQKTGEVTGGIPEAEMYRQGWRRWWEVYNLPYDVVAGHKIMSEEKISVQKGPQGQGIYLIDTGAYKNGNLTALIYPDLICVSTKLGEYKVGA